MTMIKEKLIVKLMIIGVVLGVLVGLSIYASHLCSQIDENHNKQYLYICSEFTKPNTLQIPPVINLEYKENGIYLLPEGTYEFASENDLYTLDEDEGGTYLIVKPGSAVSGQLTLNGEEVYFSISHP